jgi:hypothetical protein
MTPINNIPPICRSAQSTTTVASSTDITTPTSRKAALIRLAQYALSHGYIQWVLAIERILAREGRDG